MQGRGAAPPASSRPGGTARLALRTPVARRLQKPPRHASAIREPPRPPSPDVGGHHPPRMAALDRPAIRAAARETLGHRRLLPGQAEAVAAITGGRDTL